LKYMTSPAEDNSRTGFGLKRANAACRCVLEAEADVLLVGDVGERELLHLLAGVADDVAVRLVGMDEAPGHGIHLRHAHGRLLENRLMPLLLLAQMLHRAFRLGEVDDDADPSHDRPGLVVHWVRVWQDVGAAAVGALDDDLPAAQGAALPDRLGHRALLAGNGCAVEVIGPPRAAP